MEKLRIADLPICVDSGDADWFALRYADYVRSDEDEPILTMTTTIVDDLPCPTGEPIAHPKAMNLIRLADGRLCRYARNKAGQVVFAIEYTPDYSRADIRLRADWQGETLTLRDYEYMYTGFSFHNRLAMLGGGVLHGSSLRWRGHGVVFSADSGVGKSTHVGLWKQTFGDEVTILNDDKPAIRFIDGQPVIWGTPWSGKTALNCNESAPLDAIVFIERGTENTIRRLDAVESLCRLSLQIARPFYDRTLGERAVDLAQRLSENVPVYCLQCTISQEAVETVCRTLFPKEEI